MSNNRNPEIHVQDILETCKSILEYTRDFILESPKERSS